MNRRHFLTGAAAIAGLTATGVGQGQGPVGQPSAGRGQAGGRGYAESIGYKGLYTIEVSQDAAVRVIYNAILANLA